MCGLGSVITSSLTLLAVVRQVQAVPGADLERPAHRLRDQLAPGLALAGVLGEPDDPGIADGEQSLAEVRWIADHRRRGPPPQRRSSIA